MYEIVNKAIAALLTIAWSINCGGYEDESGLVATYKEFLGEVRKNG